MRDRGQRRFTQWLGWAAVGLSALSIVLVVVFFVPGWIVRSDFDHLNTDARVDAIAGARTATLALLAGAIALSGAAVAWRSYRLSQRTQITDQLIRALELLGHGSVGTRIGGIYALERLAHDAPDEHPAIFETLVTTIRTQSRPVGPHGVGVPTAARGIATVTPDIQAALTVVGRRDARNDTRPVDLRVADLRGADLRGADLRQAILIGANLSLAELQGAMLEGATLERAILADTSLLGVDLTDVDLTDVDVTRTPVTTGQFAALVLAEARGLGSERMVVGNLAGVVDEKTQALVDSGHIPMPAPGTTAPEASPSADSSPADPDANPRPDAP